MQISKTKIDQLGDRLRKGKIADDDLRLLDEYRRSFTDAYESVVGNIRDQLALEPTGRPAKSTTSISEKLRRESIRLTQIQDIGGCRLVVSDIAEQERVKSWLIEVFPECVLIDRRDKPSHGYRAVHVIATIDEKAVEIQLRTALQQAWAEMSEKVADVFNPALKYGGGDEAVKDLLSTASLAVSTVETHEFALLEMQQEFSTLLSELGLTEEMFIRIIELHGTMASSRSRSEGLRKETLEILRDGIQKFTVSGDE